MNKPDIEQRERDFYQQLVPYVSEYGRQTVRNFFDYWTERTSGGKKMRWETERCFQIGKRLSRWSRNNFDKSRQSLRELERERVAERNRHDRELQSIGDIFAASTRGEKKNPQKCSYEEYLALKERARQGDKEAMELLKKQ